MTVPDGTIIGVLGEAPLTFTCADSMELLQRRQKGEVLFLRGIDPRLCDEGWLVEGGVLRRGDPAEILREAGQGRQMPLHPSLRRGDGRARLLSIRTLDAAGEPTMTWRSGEEAAVEVTVEFLSPIEAPVVGIMIRTRLGFEVFGTNTELEQIAIGPVAAGTTRRVTFAFRCDLCPQEYTVTAASHDPDGRWHDWVEDAIAFRVTDSRYTAGVANLRARVRCE